MHHALGRFGLDHGGARVLIKILPDSAEHEGARGPGDQPGAEPPLEVGAPLAAGGFRAAKPPPRRGKAAGVGGLNEEVEVVELQHRKSTNMDDKSEYWPSTGSKSTHTMPPSLRWRWKWNRHCSLDFRKVARSDWLQPLNGWDSPTVCRGSKCLMT